MKPLLPLVAALILVLQSGLPLRAEVLRVRSGEHAGFTRIVLEGATSGDWRVRRGEKGYVFRATPDATTFDLSRAFDMISRDRLSGLAEREGGILDLTVSCRCHVSAFETAIGAVVIDIRDGVAPPGSRFEIPDDGGEATASRSPEAGGGSARPALPNWQPSPVEPSMADPHLPLYWRAGKTPEAPLPPGTDDRRPESLPGRAAGDSAPVADPRSGEIRAALAEQLSRAAAQGLVTFDTPPEPEPAPTAAANDLPPEAGTPEMPRLPLRVETSVDRDSAFANGGPAISAAGLACPEDSAFSPGGWGDGTPAAFQISARRQGLVGEFDKPDTDKVVALAQLYIHLGFGAEARAQLDAFDIMAAEAPWLRSLAAIVDGTGDLPPVLDGFLSCDGAVALWALLETRAPRARSDINRAALLRAFSALPLHLRRLLGPDLMERLIAAGDPGAAHAVRAAILRAGIPADPELDLASADLAQASGDEETAERSLDSLASGGSATAPDALSRAIRLRLDRGEAVPPELADNAAALAYELRHDERGPEIAGLQVLALASTGDFSRAFTEEARWRDSFPEPLGREVILSLFAMLAKTGDDWTFLTHYYRQRDQILRLDPDVLLRLDMAERLAGAGFAQETAALIKGEAAATGRGRLILARNALDEGDTARALEALAGAEGAEAAALRAVALSGQNEPAKAEAELSRSGNASAAGRATWVAGGGPRATAAAPDDLAKALGQLSHLSPGASADNVGVLEAGRSLVAATGEARSALASILRLATQSEE